MQTIAGKYLKLGAPIQGLAAHFRSIDSVRYRACPQSNCKNWLFDSARIAPRVECKILQ
jgi:hypothetical protein